LEFGIVGARSDSAEFSIFNSQFLIVGAGIELVGCNFLAAPET
jgi:hypothetical protein